MLDSFLEVTYTKTAKADAREEAARRRKFRGAVEVEVDPKDRRKQRLSGQDVWLYHGTSSKLLPKIRKEGLCPDPPRRAAPDTSSGYVYLTVRAGSAMDRGGDIHVKLTSDDEWVVLSIRDTGVGIPADKLTRVFDAYLRAQFRTA